jgi:hypothetical protein
VKRLFVFVVLTRALWLLAGSLVSTDGTAKALSLESRLNELVGNYTGFCAGLSQMPHQSPGSATASSLTSALISGGYMHS